VGPQVGSRHPHGGSICPRLAGQSDDARPQGVGRAEDLDAVQGASPIVGAIFRGGLCRPPHHESAASVPHYPARDLNRRITVMDPSRRYSISSWCGCISHSSRRPGVATVRRPTRPPSNSRCRLRVWQPPDGQTTVTDVPRETYPDSRPFLKKAVVWRARHSVWGIHRGTTGVAAVFGTRSHVAQIL